MGPRCHRPPAVVDQRRPIGIKAVDALYPTLYPDIVSAAIVKGNTASLIEAVKVVVGTAIATHLEAAGLPLDHHYATSRLHCSPRSGRLCSPDYYEHSAYSAVGGKPLYKPNRAITDRWRLGRNNSTLITFTSFQSSGRQIGVPTSGRTAHSRTAFT